ncbi:class I tRNA ligase family protein [Peribacillus simplex]|uniref:class I tRNA ligase family protein n=1 Tax=Peribacillus simplex TaxID=1478 RepID=UPI0034E859F6
MPTHIGSNEYLTLEKKKLSTSRNWAVWVPDILDRYEPDSIRYFLTINAPESRDADFSWKEFIYSHNSELIRGIWKLSKSDFDIKTACFKQGLEKVFELVRFSNKYSDEQQPWKQIYEDKDSCQQTLADCVYLVANLAHIFTPFLPFSSTKVKEMLNTTETGWNSFLVESQQLSNVEPLFERIDLARIEEELERLNKQSV